MNQQNLDYLKESLMYMGFGDKLYADLEKNIHQGFPEFVLNMQSEFSGQKVDAILFFKKPEGSDLYFFNKYDAVLRNDVGTFEHSFYLNKGHGVTFKEAFNLLQGRAVYKEMTTKEGEKYKAWIELDLKQKENGGYKIRQFHDHYGYDLKSALAGFPIKELQNETQSERLLMSLQKGNKQSVTMEVDGREQMYFLQANPQFKTITIYDRGAIRPLTAEQKNQLRVEPENERRKINGQTTQVDDLPKGKEIAGTAQKQKNSEGRERAEKKISGPNEKKEKTKKQDVSSEDNIVARNKEVKNLLPQKGDGGTGRGLRA